MIPELIKISIFPFLASLLYEMAQQQSAIISLSVMIYFAIKLQSKGIAYLTFSYFGNGFPLQRLERAHAPCLTILLSFIFLSITPTKLKIPPFLMILSLFVTQSLAMFPMAQIACSIVPRFELFKSWTNKGIPPLSTIDWHWIEVPEATLVNAHVA